MCKKKCIDISPAQCCGASSYISTVSVESSVPQNTTMSVKEIFGDTINHKAGRAHSFELCSIYYYAIPHIIFLNTLVTTSHCFLHLPYNLILHVQHVRLLTNWKNWRRGASVEKRHSPNHWLDSDSRKPVSSQKIQTKLAAYRGCNMADILAMGNTPINQTPSILPIYEIWDINNIQIWYKSGIPESI